MRDLLNELFVRELDRVLASGASREDAESALAWMQGGLWAPQESEEQGGRDNEGPARPLATRFFDEYISLSEADLLLVSPRVHEWLLDRLVSTDTGYDRRAIGLLGTIYRLYPRSTLSYAAMGALLQLDVQREGRRDISAAVVAWTGDSANDNAQDFEPDRVRDIADDILAYIDIIPDAAEQALRDLIQSFGLDVLRGHLMMWSDRFGGEAEAAIERALAGPGRFDRR